MCYGRGLMFLYSFFFIVMYKQLAFSSVLLVTSSI